jgi:hypothetical protein
MDARRGFFKKKQVVWVVLLFPAGNEQQIYTLTLLFLRNRRKARMTSIAMPVSTPDQQAGIGNRGKGTAVSPDPPRHRRRVEPGNADGSAHL